LMDSAEFYHPQITRITRILKGKELRALDTQEKALSLTAKTSCCSKGKDFEGLVSR
jgi:hypothetical protein